MNTDLEELIERLKTSVVSVPELPYYTRLKLPVEAKQSGIYILTDRNRIQYVGRANCIRRRVQQHGRPSSGHNAASFAYLIAKKKYGVKKATYKAEGSRDDLMKNEIFEEHFKNAKRRIAKMKVQYIVENDPIAQAMLEIMVATNFKALHNDFENH